MSLRDPYFAWLFCNQTVVQRSEHTFTFFKDGLVPGYKIIKRNMPDGYIFSHFLPRTYYVTLTMFFATAVCHEKIFHLIQDYSIILFSL